MSTWINIEKQEDVDYDSMVGYNFKEDSIDICIGSDNYGANYVTVPVSFIINVLKDNGYDIRQKTTNH